MSRCRLWLPSLLTLTTLVVATALSAAPPAKTSADAARLATYRKPSGEGYFALSLQPKLADTAATGRDVVVLFDTSASQTATYREDGLIALRTLLDGLQKNDRVRIMAVDLNAAAMQDNFAAVGSEAIEAAMRKLDARVPLGSTDMVGALRAAQASFDAASTNAKTVVYIGDGVSRGRLLGSPQLALIARGLVEKRISVSSYAVGPQVNVPLLAALANPPGGMIVSDPDNTVTAQQIGSRLAASVRATVAWPTAMELPAALLEPLPANLPPLRSDRDTVLIGRLADGELQSVKVTADVGGKPTQFQWPLQAEASSDDFTFLPKLVELAQADRGVSLPTVGSEGLRSVAVALQGAADEFSRLGEQALNRGDTEGARAAAGLALQNDPENPTARAVVGAADRRLQPVAADEEALKLGARPAGAAARPGDLLKQFEAEGGQFLDRIETERRVLAQKVQADVERSLAEARQRMGEDPEGAALGLKILMEDIERAVEVDADIRAQLRNKIEGAVREAGRRSSIVSDQKSRELANKAAALEAQKVVEATERRQEKVKQLMERFASLMDERRYKEAEEEIAMQVRLIEPENPTALAAAFTARNTFNIRENERLFELRHTNFVNALFQVELSHIPFPDEPPIVYPKSDVWERLTRERAKYKSVDLARTGGAEERILQELQKPTDIDFVEAPLKDVIDFLETKHGIPIELDKKGLEAAGFGTETPVTRTLKGITLRSGLRLLLKDFDLTYVIRDEVLLITSQDEATKSLVTKVYPVADLVMPIISGGGQFGVGGGGGGQMGGGMGGMGGGMGGMGGGMGGMGGGMGGMGGGMGGGMFVVEEEAIRIIGKKKGVETPPAPTKKPAAPAADATKTGATKAEATKAGATRPDAAKAKAPKMRVPRIDLEVRPGVSPTQAWDQHFANREEPVAMVRQTARQLMDEKKFPEVVSMLQAAIRHGQVQPWMYEAMSLALQATDAPVEDIERSLMSAVDFARSDEEVMHVAQYMARIGLHGRALKLFQDLAVGNPFDPVAYVSGLASAQATNDLAGIEWACVGILSQAWPAEQRHIEQNARRVALATLAELRDAGQKVEAAKFEAACNAALARDCVVKVTWTGEADIDIQVSEPSGTVCSLRSPRSTAGGVLMGDSFASKSEMPAEGYSEIYACPQAFSGEYRALLRRVWGKVAAGHVTVDVFTHYGTKQQTHMRQNIPLSDKDALIIFKLEDGRRAMPVAEAQVANIARAQINVNRAVLAQQLDASGENSQAVRDRAFAAWQQQGAPNGRLPFGRPGAVGFRPVIQTFREGNQMDAMAIISADRRYVRFTLLGSQPVASGITSVSTFNFVAGTTGNNGGQQGGQGGQGGGGIGGGGGQF